MVRSVTETSRIFIVFDTALWKYYKKSPSGIPDEMFFLPENSGFSFLFVLLLNLLAAFCAPFANIDEIH